MFKKKEIKQIEDAVAAAELKTSGEIVPMVVGASRSYLFVYLIFAIAGFAAACIYLFVTPPAWGEDLSLNHIILTQLSGIVLFLLLSLFPFIRRLLLPRKWLKAIVNRAALSNFVAGGLLETRDRTGILIYISRFERCAVILADKGIDQATPDNYWQDQINIILKGIKKRKAAAALTRAITDIGNKLAENFPPRADDTDELSNKVRLEREDN
ncbi:MAG TPA: hypothetical protein VKS21_10980 [Spirochaetota bacterium]|nr:hypothetical protein [Spirochaetota bacterium]